MNTALSLLLSAVSLAAQEGVVSTPPSASTSEQVARFALSAEPSGFDPVQSSQLVDAIAQRQILECLTEYDYLACNEQVQGLLADTWTVSEDQLQWVFHLRKDACFYDPFDPPLWPARQRSVVAKDVLFSWLRMADARNPSLGYWAMEDIIVGLDGFRQRTAALDPASAKQAWQQALAEGISGLQVLNEREIQITLNQADPHFPQRLAMTHFAIYPHEAVEAEHRNMLDQPVGSGPFVVQSWVPGQSLVLKATPQWRGQPSPFGDGVLPFLQRVEIHTVRDPRTAMNLFERGQLERLSLGNAAMHHFLDSELALKAEFRQQGFQLHPYALPDITMLCFGMTDPILGTLPGDKEGNAKRRLLRQALALCFPYEQWSSRIRGAIPAIAARNFLPPVVPGSAELPASSWNHYDLEQARRLLAQAGYADGKSLPTLEFAVTGTGAISRAIGDLYVAAAKQVGISLKPVLLPYREQLQRARDGQSQIFLRAWVLDWPDAALILQTFAGNYAGTEVNLCGFRNPSYDRLFSQLRALPEGEARNKICQQLLNILDEEVPAVAIDHRQGWLLTQAWLENFHVHPFDILPTKYYRITPHE